MSDDDAQTYSYTLGDPAECFRRADRLAHGLPAEADVSEADAEAEGPS